MKNKKINFNHRLVVIGIGLLASGSLTHAANFDSLDHTPSNFGSLEQATPDSTSGSDSVLNSLQQSQADNKKDRYVEVLNLLKQNKIDEAQSKISVLLKESPEEPQFYNLQALVDTFKKDTAAAQQSYQKAVDLDKSNLAAYLGLAKLALDAGDFPTASDHANKLLAINNKFTSAYMVLADIAYKQKNNAEVERLLQSGLQKIKGNVAQEIEFISMLGKFYVAQKQPEKLLALADDLVKHNTGNTQALALLAGAQIANTKPDLAEQTIRQIIKKDERDINHRLLLVKLMSSNPKNEADILQLLDETANIDTNNPQANVYKAAYLIKLKHTQEALALADKLEKQFPNLAIGKLLKADAYLSDKQLDKALENYKLVYKTEPNNNVLFTMADIMQSKGKTNEAIALLDAESAKNSKNDAIHFKLATLYQLQNNFSQAQIHYEAVLNHQADNALALNNLAWLYSQQNNPKSLELAKKAYGLAPDSGAIADTYGYILVKQGMAKDALPILEKATSIAPKDNDIQFHLAEAHAATDNKAKAIEILEMIMKSEQSFSEKAQAEALLTRLKTS
jgi:putative PEP-CTERM system TPR-repeat lipoprotein